MGSRAGWCVAVACAIPLCVAACANSRSLPLGQRYISINYPAWASDDEMVSGMREAAAKACPTYHVVTSRIVPMANGRPQHIEAIIDCTPPASTAALNDEVERHVRLLVVKTRDEAERIRNNLARGQDFAVAAGASIDRRNRERGGDAGFWVYSDMAPALADVVFHLPLHQVSEPIPTKEGWALIRVDEERPVPADHAAARRGHGSYGGGRQAADGKLELIGNGSGFFVSKTGMLLTNNHVVAECTKMRVDVKDKLVLGRVLRTDPVNDLAVIKFDVTPDVIASFRDGPYVRPGDTVVAAGYPLTDILAPELNITTGAVSSLAGMGGNASFVQMTAPVQPGNSGGPLLDSSGQVVGIVESKLTVIPAAAGKIDIPENVNFAVKSSIARVFLEDAGVAPVAARPGRILSAADVGEIARSFTVRVDCLK